MAKMNPQTARRRVAPTAQTPTKNPHGEVAYTNSPEEQLYRLAATSLLEDTFYSKTSEQYKRMKELVTRVDPGFALRLARYSRNEMNLRSFPVALLVEVAMLDAGKPKPEVRQFVPQIVLRADEITEALAYYITTYGGVDKRTGDLTDAKLPGALKRGLADAFANFNAYQLAKYRRKSADKGATKPIVNLAQALRILHPTPKDAEQSDVFRQLRDGTLAAADTWERRMSAEGSNTGTWEEQIESWVQIRNGRVYVRNYMAMLRNVRNVLRHGVSERHIGLLCKGLTNAEAVASSKQLPWRFYSAYKQVERVRGANPFTQRKVLGAIEVAMNLSVVNVPDFEGNTVVLCDVSGSMQDAISGKGNKPYYRNGVLVTPERRTRAEVASLMAAIAYAKGAIVGAFATNFQWANLEPAGSIIGNAERIQQMHLGGGTIAHKGIDAMIQGSIKADRVILTSDMQCYSVEANTNQYVFWPTEIVGSLRASWSQYKRSINPAARFYSLDVAGESTTQFPDDEPDAFMLAGFSERVFSLIPFLEGGNNVVSLIAGSPTRMARGASVADAEED